MGLDGLGQVSHLVGGGPGGGAGHAEGSLGGHRPQAHLPHFEVSKVLGWHQSGWGPVYQRGPPREAQTAVPRSSQHRYFGCLWEGDCEYTEGANACVMI